MKSIFFFLLMAVGFTSFAQTDEPLYPWIDDDTLFVTPDLAFIVGQDVKLGTGTMPNGDFKYITFSRGNWVSAMNGDLNMNYIGSKWSGHKFRIKNLKKYGTKKRGYTFYLLLGGGNIVNYECDIENALKAGEIVVDGYTPASQRPVIVQQTSKADELKKLKALRDDGTLTEDEYQSEKKKLLDK